MNTPPIPTPNDQASPVTWHVIVWVLLSLAINCMAQPSDYAGATSWIYLAVSPFMCAADALSFLLSVLCIWYKLGGAIGTATRCAIHWRLKGNLPADSAHIKHHREASWLRWILFLVGTAPALIKLAAFSGLPWSKTWGLMFGVSYLVIEFVTNISTLGLSQEEWYEDADQGLKKLPKKFDVTVMFICTPIWFLALIGEFALNLWTINDLQLQRIFVEHNIWIPFNIYDVTRTVVFFMFAGWLTLKVPFWTMWVIIILRRVLDRQPGTLERSHRFLNRWWNRIDRLLKYLFGSALVVLVFFVPQENGSPLSLYADTHAWISTMTVGIMSIVVYLAIEKFWWLLCSRIPRLGRILLVAAPASSDSDTGDEGEQGQKEEQERVRKNNKDLTTGVSRLTHFCVQILIGVLWYAMRYDPEGTVNPGWTDVFG